MTQSLEHYLLLLRGINVGGKNRLAMAALTELVCTLGATSVQTYIQSGNVVCAATPTLARSLAGKLQARLLTQLGLTIPVLMRSAAECQQVLKQNPFLNAGEDPEQLHVMFLAEPPSPARLATLDPARSPGDQFAVVGRDIYLKCPNGVARTKLTTSYFDSHLKTVSSMRNWRTVCTLASMCRTTG